MFGKNPLEFQDEIDGDRLCDALRLAIIAELDAITLYRQISERVKEPLAKKVFEEVAEEEKEHIGEFMYLLKRCDSTIVSIMNKGEEEVREIAEALTGK